MQSKEQFYRDRIAQLESTTASLGKNSDRISRRRLLVAVLIVGAVYLSFSTSLYFFWVVLALLVFFFRLVQSHVRNTEEVEIVAVMTGLSRNELKMLQGDHSVLDPGPAGGRPDHIYAGDLDIFGTTSLFKVVNRTVTHEGRSRVISALLNPLADTNAISRQKGVVAELSDIVDWRQRFYAVGSRSGETDDDMTEVALWLEEPWFFQNRGYWLWIAGAIGLGSLSFISWMIAVGQFYLGFFVALLVVNSSIFFMFNRHGRLYFNKFGTRTSLFRKFAVMFEMVAGLQLRSDLGVELRQQITAAGKAFIKLSRLHNLAEQRANNLVSFVMNGLFFLDVWTLYRIESWRRQHKDRTMHWVEALGQVDLLSSYANFRFNHPSFNDAEIVSASPFIKATAMSHPLILPAAAVVNDYEVGTVTKAHVITGSNMAGKSTFIRAVGLNVVLALNGLPVCAREFSCSPMQIASCIRITDSLEDHASYFKAELDRLGIIVSLLQTGKPYLVLLDEILRGTNSEDKRLGTLSFYRKLSGLDCICLLATHDLAIGELERENPGSFANYCFESKVVGSEMLFDYKLRRGVSSSANATFLMKQLKLID